MITVRVLLLVAMGGALGALCRYGVSVWASRWMGGQFPWGTLLVNVGGCLLLGWLLQWAESSSGLSEAWRIGISAGFLGGLTTFSTFGVETFRLMQSASWALCFANLISNLALGLAGVWLGIQLGRWGAGP